MATSIHPLSNSKPSPLKSKRGIVGTGSTTEQLDESDLLRELELYNENAIIAEKTRRKQATT
jgi:hypothetical protein